MNTFSENGNDFVGRLLPSHVAIQEKRVVYFVRNFFPALDVTKNRTARSRPLCQSMHAAAGRRASRKILCLCMLVGCGATVVPALRPGFVHSQLLPLSRSPECWTRTCTRRVVVAAKRKDQDGTRKMLSDPEVVAHMQVLHAGPFHTHYFKLQKQGHG